MDKKRFIKSQDGCVIEDSEVIVTGIATVVTVGLFIANTAILVPKI